MKLNRLIFGAMFAVALSACASSTANDGAKGAKTKAAPAKTEAAAAAKKDVVKNFTGGRITPDAKLPMVIDFNATWCGPCRQFAPVFHEAAKKYAGKAVFVSVDVDKAQEAAMQFEVRSIPQVTILFPDGTSKSTVGFMNEEQFDALLKDVAKLK